jgi:hypothetical protein
MTNEGKEKTEDFINTTTSTNFIDQLAPIAPTKLTTDTNTDHIPPERFQDAGYRANFCTIRHHRRFPRG